MARAGLSHDAVVRIALDLVDAGGPTGCADLPLATVAAQAGVAAPGVLAQGGRARGPRREVAVVAVGDYTRALTDATVGLAGPDAVAALAHATRRYARAHPGRYAAVQVAPDPDDPADAARAAAAGGSVQGVAAVVRGGGLGEGGWGCGGAGPRASLHGFVALALGGGSRLRADHARGCALLGRALLPGQAALARPPAGA